MTKVETFTAFFLFPSKRVPLKLHRNNQGLQPNRERYRVLHEDHIFLLPQGDWHS